MAGLENDTQVLGSICESSQRLTGLLTRVATLFGGERYQDKSFRHAGSICHAGGSKHLEQSALPPELHHAPTIALEDFYWLQSAVCL